MATLLNEVFTMLNNASFWVFKSIGHAQFSYYYVGIIGIDYFCSPSFEETCSYTFIHEIIMGIARNTLELLVWNVHVIPQCWMKTPVAIY